MAIEFFAFLLALTWILVVLDRFQIEKLKHQLDQLGRRHPKSDGLCPRCFSADFHAAKSPHTVDRSGAVLSAAVQHLV